MSIKYFCDSCDRELTEEVSATGGYNVPTRLGASLQKPGKPLLKVEVMVFNGQTANDGHWCRYCILDALYRLDDRPKDGHATLRTVK